MAGCAFVNLPKELNNSKKGLINLHNRDNKSFMWRYVRHLNPVSDHASRIKRADKKIVEKIDHDGIDFPVKVKDVGVIEDKNEICINVFSYKHKIVCAVYVSTKKYDNCMNLLMIHEGDKSHYVYVKDFNRLMFNVTKDKQKKWFCMKCLKHFSNKIILEHKENCSIRMYCNDV